MAPASLEAMSWSWENGRAQLKNGCPGDEGEVLRPCAASGLRPGLKAFKRDDDVERSWSVVHELHRDSKAKETHSQRKLAIALQ